MNTTELEHIFKANHVPTRYYSFAGPGGGDCFVLECRASQWAVYYSERGTRREEGIFNTEDEACRAMFELIKETVQNGQGRAISLNV